MWLARHEFVRYGNMRAAWACFSLRQEGRDGLIGTTVYARVVVVSIVAALGAFPSAAQATDEQGASSGAVPYFGAYLGACFGARFGLSTCTPAPASCTPAPPKVATKQHQLSGWNLEITPYLWVAGFRGDVGVTIGQKVLAVPLDVSFSELSENLKIGAMGSVRFRLSSLRDSGRGELHRVWVTRCAFGNNGRSSCRRAADGLRDRSSILRVRTMARGDAQSLPGSALVVD